MEAKKMKAHLALWVVALALAACAPVPGTDDITGTYTLVSVEGNPLPYNPAHEVGAPEIISSTLTLASDSTFQMTITFATAPGNPVSRDMKGTYSLVDGTLSFDWEGAGITPATHEDGTITIVNEGLSFLYQK
jgi:hypothetical protein